MKIKYLQYLMFLVAFSMPANAAERFVEPRLTLPAIIHGPPRVALTLDACMGAVDNRILNTLIDNNIPATIFATARWLARNKPALERMRQHAALFEIENHGARHVPAIDVPATVYGIAAAGSAAAVDQEVAEGAAAITKATGIKPRWFRGATGLYTKSSLQRLQDMRERVAGYSRIADGGALLSRAQTARNIEHARSGDVLIAHVNQPDKPAGLGVVDGILALKARGFQFVKLEDAGFSK